MQNANSLAAAWQSLDACALNRHYEPCKQSSWIPARNSHKNLPFSQNVVGHIPYTQHGSTHTHTQTYTTCMYRNLPVLFGAQELLDPWLYLGLVIFAMYPAPSDDVVFLDYDEKNIYIIIIATIIILSERKSIFINNFKFPHNIYFLLHFLLLSLNWL